KQPSLPRGDVQRVRRAVGKAVFVRVIEVEDVVRLDHDLADDGAGRLELGKRRNRLGQRAGGVQDQQGAEEDPQKQKRARPLAVPSCCSTWRSDSDDTLFGPAYAGAGNSGMARVCRA